MKQVVTVDPVGVVSGLQVKPGRGLDLRFLGRANISRVSEIEWNQNAQKWQIRILLGPYAGKLITDKMARKPGGLSEPALFAEYDSAVDTEVAVLNALRLEGKFYQHQ